MKASKARNEQHMAVSESWEQLTRIICWTRMQSEAGQDLSSIVLRKELERKSGDGLFCWGIGNAPPRSIGELARQGETIDVVFSKMKSRPKASDVAPSKVAVWRSYFDVGGEERMLPPHVLITSSAKANNRPHYALMCRSQRELCLMDMGAFDPLAYRNVSEAARPVGASQVTALLRKVTAEHVSESYRINLRATLTKSYWVKLGNPCELPSRKTSELLEMLADIISVTPSDWLKFVLRAKSQSGNRRRKSAQQLALFAA